MHHIRQTLRTTTPTMLASLLAACAPAPMIGAGAIALSAGVTLAQTSASTASDDAEMRKAKRETLIAMSKPVSLDVSDQPIQDVFAFLADVTGADLEPIYLNNDFASTGIDPQTQVTIKVKEVPALIVLERVLLRAARAEATGEEYTWQLTEFGGIECGPKSELNRNQRLEIYDVSDLLYVVPDFNNAPEFDLQSAVQAAGGGGGGGGGQSPFSSGNSGQDDIKNLAERAEDLENLITATVEPDQWADLGGDGAAITFYNRSFIITAPDYIHRQINGYAFWPAKLQQVRKVKGRQHVTIKPSTKP